MFLNSQNYVKLFTDMMSEGFITIDSKGIIQIYNNKAKEIFGIVHDYKTIHSEGKIKEGDIVIIGDNCLGRDDGNLNGKDLKYLGIEDKNIEKEDAILAIGVFQQKEISPIYKYLKPNNKSNVFKLKTNYLGIELEALIDFLNKTIIIEVNSEKFSMNYINAIGHMVVLDGKTKKMKFYQAQGYTARKESIKELLMGAEYLAKGKKVDVLDVIGKNIFEIHKDTLTIKEFYKVAKGGNISYTDEFKEINGIPTMCTLTPIDKDGIRMGAALKVEDISEIKQIIRERDQALLNLEKMEMELKQEKILDEVFPKLIGYSKEIEHVKRLTLKASKTNSTVLILGESGTGKTVLAKTIHENSKFKDNSFIHVNCGSIPNTLLETELFGYEKGAFTGARKEGKIGFFEMAHGGTIFLDEIGDIPLNLQVKLLQVLQEKSFYRVGGTKKVDINLRIIAATNKNLEEEMQEGRFREDLYYRINVFPIWIPPLRERTEDIYSLVDALLPKICKQIGVDTKRISAEALNLLTKYDWPGNVRELENILERAINLSEGSTILSKHIILNMKDEEHNTKDIIPLRDAVSHCEKNMIKRALELYKGNKKQAMKALGISKTTFYEKLKKHEIN